MTRQVIATPLFVRHLKNFLDECAELGAIRFVERLRESYRAMVDIAAFEEISPARRRLVKGKCLTVRKYRRSGLSRPLLGSARTLGAGTAFKYPDWWAKQVPLER